MHFDQWCYSKASTPASMQLSEDAQSGKMKKRMLSREKYFVNSTYTKITKKCDFTEKDHESEIS